MINQDARPAFAARKKKPEFYLQVQAYVRSLQSTKTLRQIADMLNASGSRSPTNALWDRQKLSNIMRSRSV